MRLKKASIFSVLSLIIVLALVSFAESAVFTIKPSLLISEEYNDNIFLERRDKSDDYITRLMPSITLNYETGLWKWDVKYTLDYRYYVKNSIEDDLTHNLEAETRLELLKERLFVIVRDEYSRVSLDVTRDFTRESLFLNQSDRNIFTLNPYFILRPSQVITVTTGYEYVNTWYEEDIAIDRIDNIAYIKSTYELSPRLILNAGYRFTQEENDVEDYTKNDIYIGSKYEYAEGSFLFFTLGHSWLDYETGDNIRHIYWNAGITHTFTLFTASLESGRDYLQDPEGTLTREDRYIASLRKTMERSTFNVSFYIREYRDFETEDLDTRTYGTGGNISYELTPRVTGKLEFVVEKLDRKLEDTYTRRYLGGLSIDYTVSEDMTLSFIYRYSDSHSPEIPDDNYTNNRFLLELKKSF